ncbi:hypothetical protein V8B97DRAFT_1920277 [Scleroderma yunnanense]
MLLVQLMAKHGKFENAFQVPEVERLKTRGWGTNFCKVYNLKEFCRYGEAGSVDIEAVAKEREQIQKIYTEYPSEDNLNFDESDCGLASKQMSGKKSNKFQITFGFMCNATGTEKWLIFYIGKSKQP